MNVTGSSSRCMYKGYIVTFIYNTLFVPPIDRLIDRRTGGWRNCCHYLSLFPFNKWECWFTGSTSSFVKLSLFIIFFLLPIHCFLLLFVFGFVSSNISSPRCANHIHIKHHKSTLQTSKISRLNPFYSTTANFLKKSLTTTPRVNIYDYAWRNFILKINLNVNKKCKLEQPFTSCATKSFVTFRHPRIALKHFWGTQLLHDLAGPKDSTIKVVISFLGE